MRKISLLFILMAVGAAVYAKDLKGRVICDADNKGVGFARLIVESPDTIVSCEADRKGRFRIGQLLFPVTITVKAAGMLESTVGLISMPESKFTIEVSPDPAAVSVTRRRRVDWSSDRPRRLTSTYVVRPPVAKR